MTQLKRVFIGVVTLITVGSFLWLGIQHFPYVLIGAAVLAVAWLVGTYVDVLWLSDR